MLDNLEQFHTRDRDRDLFKRYAALLGELLVLVQVPPERLGHRSGVAGWVPFVFIDFGGDPVPPTAAAPEV